MSVTSSPKADSFYVSLGQNIRQFRKTQGYTQSQLAFEADVSRNLLMNIEQGKVKNTSLETLRKLSRVLNVTVIEILDFS